MLLFLPPGVHHADEKKIDTYQYQSIDYFETADDCDKSIAHRGTEPLKVFVVAPRTGTKAFYFCQSISPN